ncbi:MAG: enoyl-CoA hydratase/isomerase family protein [Leptospira sp.]|nr:enoyl-CoA hydratase/isomerase family protein [Leptospira sp.]
MNSQSKFNQYEYLEISETETSHGRIVSVFLNNPNSRNSMTWKMGEEFYHLIQQIWKQKNLPRALVLSGKNDVFCAGGDLNLLRSFSEKSFSQNKRDMKKFYSFFLSVRDLPIPVIAACNGHAIGAGLSLAFACDFRIFAEEGKYSFNFVRLGIHPGMGSSYLAPELLGKSLGTFLLMSGDQFDGKRAKEIGLAYDVVTKQKVIERAMELAESLTKASPLAIQELKANLYSKKKLDQALKKEAESQARNFISEDFKETIQSILEKREPKFLGR